MGKTKLRVATTSRLQHLTRDHAHSDSLVEMALPMKNHRKRLLSEFFSDDDGVEDASDQAVRHSPLVSLTTLESANGTFKASEPRSVFNFAPTGSLKTSSMPTPNSGTPNLWFTSLPAHPLFGQPAPIHSTPPREAAAGFANTVAPLNSVPSSSFKPSSLFATTPPAPRPTSVPSSSFKPYAPFAFIPPAAKPNSNLTLPLPQYGLLGLDVEHSEPVFLNTNTPNSVFLCGSQGSGKSYTLACMLENNLLAGENDSMRQKQPIPGFVYHYDTNSSGSVAEAASLCTRGIKVRVLVSWSNYQQMKHLYESFATARKAKVEVRPLLFHDAELTAGHIYKLMSFGNHDNPPLYQEVLSNILRATGRSGQPLSIQKFFQDIKRQDFNPGQTAMLDQRLSILKNFSAVKAYEVVQEDHPHLGKDKPGGQKALDAQYHRNGLILGGSCIRVEQGTLTIIDLSDPFLDANTACMLLNICHSVILKRHQEAILANRIKPGLIITLDEAHKFLDTALGAAETFTNSLLTTIREQRHNAARVVIATQEPTISERLLDLCSVSIIHRFSSPAWFQTIRQHLGGASSLSGDEAEKSKGAELFERIQTLETGESLVFSPTSFVRGDADKPEKLGSGVMKMKTRRRAGDDAGKSVNVL